MKEPNLFENLTKKQAINPNGKIVQVLGAVVDVKFEDTSVLPPILTALECNNNGKKLVLE
ncbi:MAG: hypothetical protein IKR60_02490, partial [Alphaproteobacteria bacterium]|nr:hypothetical protein [Alphaproteobacteria bacterium]